jgi:hypothetical protein
VYEGVELAGLLWRFLGCVPIGLNIIGILEVRLNVNNSAICNKIHLEDTHHHLTNVTISRLKRGSSLHEGEATTTRPFMAGFQKEPQSRFQFGKRSSCC